MINIIERGSEASSPESQAIFIKYPLKSTEGLLVWTLYPVRSLEMPPDAGVDLLFSLE